MHTQELPPPQAAAHAVASLWRTATPAADLGPAAPIRVLPDGCLDLIARFRTRPDGRADGPPEVTVVGPTDRFLLVEASPGTTWVGVRFRPGMAGSCLGVSPVELLGRETPASDCLPHLKALLDQISGCQTPGRALIVFVRTLPDLATDRRRGGVPPRIKRALELFEAGGGTARVSAVARAVGVSERTLHRDILGAVGLPPKTLVRVFRLQRTVALLRATERPDLCAAALEGGYADQPHMTREFRALAGLPPAALLG